VLVTENTLRVHKRILRRGAAAELICEFFATVEMCILRRSAAAELSPAFQRRESRRKFPASRQRRLNSGVADATREQRASSRGLMVFEN